MAQHNSPHILVVDDEEQVRRLLRKGLEPEGYRVSEGHDGAHMQAILEREPIDLITLDLSLDGEDGLKLAREVRSKRNVPIVMITGKCDTIDRVVGLELGADDYITKPFHIREVLARIRAVLRRYEGPSADAGLTGAGGERYAFEGWALDCARRELKTASGQARELTTAELDLLAILVKRPGRVLSRDDLMDLLKGHDWTPLDRSIDGLVARLRRKIEPESERPRLIKTVRGVGYVFAGDVRKL
jgi:two-component system, OmpR family, response regulator